MSPQDQIKPSVVLLRSVRFCFTKWRIGVSAVLGGGLPPGGGDGKPKQTAESTLIFVRCVA